MNRKLQGWCALSGICLLAVGGIGAAQDHGGKPYRLVLTGAAERPGPGDPDGTGTALITVNFGQAEVCYALDVQNIALPAIGAHIHRAPVTDAGPIVVPLTAPDASGHSEGCVRVDRVLARELLKTPEAFYVNVHSTEFPAGAVRAQLAE